MHQHLPFGLAIRWAIFRVACRLLNMVPTFARGWKPFKKYFWQPEELEALSKLKGDGVFCIEQKTGLIWQSTDTIQ